ncbi:MAG: FecR domain-containing protein [Gemmatimonadota bacterium]
MDERMVRVLNGTATELEQRQVERWRAESAAHEAEWREWAAVWELTAPDADGAPPAPTPESLVADAESRRRRSGARASRRALLRSPRMAWALAAAAVVALVAFGLERHGSPPAGPALTAVGSTEGADEVTTLDLSDGSTVRLGASSRLEFPSAPGRREVVLDGRAFFAVAHADTPFEVRTDAGRVVVRGTRFEVRTDGDGLRVVVVEGVVDVETARGRVRIAPGEVARVDGSGLTAVSTTEDVWSLLDWPGGLLVFQATPLAAVGAQLERRFGRPVRVSSAAAPLRVTAWFGNEPLAEVVEAVCLVAGVRCTVADTVVVGR